MRPQAIAAHRSCPPSRPSRGVAILQASLSIPTALSLFSQFPFSSVTVVHHLVTRLGVPRAIRCYSLNGPVVLTLQDPERPIQTPLGGVSLVRQHLWQAPGSPPAAQASRECGAAREPWWQLSWGRRRHTPTGMIQHRSPST